MISLNGQVLKNGVMERLVSVELVIWLSLRYFLYSDKELMFKWRVAELQPPHLKAMNIDEGWTDMYRELVYHGGIPDSWFWPYLQHSWGRAINELEDLATETAEHPFFDDFWKTKACDFSKIITPAYIVNLLCLWADTPRLQVGRIKVSISVEHLRDLNVSNQKRSGLKSMVKRNGNSTTSLSK